MDFKTFFDTSRAQLRQGKPAQVKLGRVERHRPAGLIHTNTRSPACGGLYWYKLWTFVSELSVFKRPKNREDSSKFDDFWTKRIVSVRPISGKKFERTKRTKSFRKIRKFFRIFFEKFFGKFLAYIRDASLRYWIGPVN